MTSLNVGTNPQLWFHTFPEGETIDHENHYLALKGGKRLRIELMCSLSELSINKFSELFIDDFGRRFQRLQQVLSLRDGDRNRSFIYIVHFGEALGNPAIKKGGKWQ